MAPATPRFTLLDAAGQPVDRDHSLVLDQRTGLMWPAAHLPDRLTLSAAEQACAELRTGGFTDWRIPTCDELLSIVDRTRYEPAIDTAAFPNTPSNWFWTSTPTAWASSFAWIVSFDDGRRLRPPRQQRVRARGAFPRSVIGFWPRRST